MKIIIRTVKIMLMTVAMILVISSCEDQLTTGSSTALGDEQVTSDVVGLQKVLRAAYVNLLFGERTYGGQEAGAYVGIPGFNLYYDISGEDIMSTNNYGYSGPDCYQFGVQRTTSAPVGAKIWRMMYTIINQANTVLDYLDDAAGDQVMKEALAGQAKAMRGICYFHIVLNYQQTYAIAKNKRGVIIRTSLINQPTELGFSTVEETYTQIVKDLTEAKSHLANFARTDKWQINADIASGYLARVYQVMGNWQGAYNEANAVYAKYSALMTKEQWCGGHCDITVPEVIWAVINNEISNNGDNTEFSYWHNQDPSYGEGMSDGPIYNFLNLLVDQGYVDLFDDTDYRGTKCTKAWYEGIDANLSDHVSDDDEKGVMFWHRTHATELLGRDKWAYNKFKYYGDNGLGEKGSRNLADYSILRSSEMLLVKAEAEANLDRTGEALASLNTLQATRKAKLTTTTSKADLLEAIYVERRKELLGEGVTGMYDWVRLQKDMIRKVESAANPAGHFLAGTNNLDKVDNNTWKMPSNDYRYFCQIPLAEFSYNSAIDESVDQNPTTGR